MAIRTLQWIRVADPEAGRVDDLQICIPNRVDAYQIKWSEYGGSLTFNDLVVGEDNESSLIAQLAQGWTRLKEIHQQRAVVHLITNQHPSNSPRATIPFIRPAPRPTHFAAFLAQAWAPARSSSEDPEAAVPVAWRPA
jgi:hypothetical protein